MIIVAFDPGKETSWARFDTENPWAIEIGTVDLIGSSRLTRPCPIHIAEITQDADGVIVEEVGARPGQGVSAMFTFGLSVGTILGALSASGKRLVLVTPQEWKKSSRLGGCEKEESKRAALRYAKELWPEHEKIFRVHSNHGLAEAALMARWFFMDGTGKDVSLEAGSPMKAPAPVQFPKIPA